MKLFRFGVLLIAFSLMMGMHTYAQGKGKGKGKEKSESHGEGHGQGQGQEQKSPEEKAKARTNWMKNKLGLSASQEQGVYNLYLASFQEMQQIRQTVKGPDKKAQIQVVRNKMENQLKGILTSEQYATYLKLKEDRKNKGEKEDDDDDENEGEMLPNTPKGQTTPKGSTIPNTPKGQTTPVPNKSTTKKG